MERGPVVGDHLVESLIQAIDDGFLHYAQGIFHAHEEELRRTPTLYKAFRGYLFGEKPPQMEEEDG